MQRRLLVRARGLASFREALAALAIEGGPRAARRRLVVVPTRAAGELLRQTIERHAVASGAAVVLPDMVTRDEWLRRLHEALPGAPPLLTRIEREVLLGRAARATLARRAHTPRPFQLRPGLVAAMLEFYDELGRRQRLVRRFARGLFDELRVERGTDRGSDGLINQTCFLGFAFLAYARAVEASGGLDEHALRRRLLDEQPALPFTDLVVAVADHPADPRGLWPVDFDVIGRLTHLGSVRIVMTDEAHDAGFRDRLERELPGVEETRAQDRSCAPHLLVPADAPETLAFVSRDREEELRDVARDLRQSASANARPTAVVFHRPLPYLYLAQQMMTDARVPYQAFDALPLAAEPYAALLDVVLTVARTGGTRETILTLLRSSLLAVTVGGRRVSHEDVSALERVLTERRAGGGPDTYRTEVEQFLAGRPMIGASAAASARRAAEAAAAVITALAPYRVASTTSERVAALAAFLRTHERPVDREEEWAGRYRRARAAVLAVLDGLVEACARHDDVPRDHEDIATLIHHALEAQTFTPRRGHDGVHLVDAEAAKFGEFSTVYLVGLAETDWSPRRRRNIFYASGLLTSLGWPQDTDLAAAEQAAFRDVLTLAKDRTRLSTFELDGDTVVARSPMIELARSLVTQAVARPVAGGLFADEVLATGAAPPDLAPEAAAWLARRHERPPLGTPAYAGQVDARPAGTYRVSQVDRYVSCPFKYFAAHVLRLDEERDEWSGLSPLERGSLLHTLFEAFYAEWQRDGYGAITRANMNEALLRFDRVVTEALAALPDVDRSLEHMRLVGSLVGRGVAERVFELEAAAGVEVRERLIEQMLDGPFTFPAAGGPISIRIRGKADRIDVLEDGSLRVVDYKLGRMPDLDSSIQVAVYAHCAQQVLESRDGGGHPVAAAMYLAFGDDRKLDGRMGSSSEPVAGAVGTRVRAFSEVVGRIEAGEFPPRPLRPGDCQWCGFAGVCRKEYRLDVDESADAV